MRFATPPNVCKAQAADEHLAAAKTTPPPVRLVVPAARQPPNRNPIGHLGRQHVIQDQPLTPAPETIAKHRQSRLRILSDPLTKLPGSYPIVFRSLTDDEPTFVLKTPEGVGSEASSC